MQKIGLALARGGAALAREQAIIVTEKSKYNRGFMGLQQKLRNLIESDATRGNGKRTVSVEGQRDDGSSKP